MIQSFTRLWDSLFSTSGELIPRLIGAFLILILGWILASVFKNLVKKLIDKSGIDNKLRSSASGFSFSLLISRLCYYLAMVYVLVLVLAQAGVTGALEPIQNMLDEFLVHVPNVLVAILVGIAGYMLARVISEAVGLAGPALDSLSDKAGIKSVLNLTALAKQLTFLVIFIPLLIQALRYLKMNAIVDPATDMLSEMLGVIPNIIGAALVLGVFYIFGRYVISILVQLMKNAGIDGLTSRMGITAFIGEEKSFSTILGNIGLFFLMFMGVLSAVEILGFEHLSEILNDLFYLSGQIFFGLLILMIGNQISDMVASYVAKSESQALGSIVRIATLGLFIAISLRAMGIANEIVHIAFMLILGAVAVAFALAYGLGGREAAGQHFKDIIQKLKN